MKRKLLSTGFLTGLSLDIVCFSLVAVIAGIIEPDALLASCYLLCQTEEGKFHIIVVNLQISTTLKIK